MAEIVQAAAGAWQIRDPAEFETGGAICTSGRRFRGRGDGENVCCSRKSFTWGRRRVRLVR